MSRKNFASLYGLTCTVILASAGAVPAAGAGELTEGEIGQKIRFVENGLRPAFCRGETGCEKWTLEERMRHYKTPGVSIAVIEDGELLWAKAYGVKDAESGGAVDTDTVFSVGSVSKVAAAAIALRLAAQGDVDLDADVNHYLKSWRIPPSEFTKDRPVTMRTILSHTSGLSVNGFPDFLPGEELPTAIDTLEGRPPAKTPPVRSEFTPGTKMRYSGGAITVEQVLIADVTGQSFEAAAREEVFGPLSMTRSTFENPLPAAYSNIAKAHDEMGALAAAPRGWQTFPEVAASGLWTTPTDIAKLIIAQIESYHGEADAFLPADIAVDMMTEVGPSIFGLGPRLAGEGRAKQFVHGGSNESYKAWMEGHLETGDGVVIFTNGANGQQLYYEIRRAVSDAMGWPTYEPAIEYEAGDGDEFLAAIPGEYAVNSPSSLSSMRVTLLQEIKTAKIAIKDGAAFLLVSGVPLPPIRLIRTGPLTFVAEGSYMGTPNLIRLEFIRNARGEVNELAFHHDRYSWSATRREEE